MRPRDVIKSYVSELLSPSRSRLTPGALKVAERKAGRYFRLFNANHKYLAFSILLCRKRPNREQAELFGEVTERPARGAAVPFGREKGRGELVWRSG